MRQSQKPLAHGYPQPIRSCVYPNRAIYGQEAMGDFDTRQGHMPRTKIDQEQLRAGTDRDYTLKEWLAKRRISEAKFWDLHKRGLGPDIVQVKKGARVTITREADEAWAHKFLRQSGKE